jgi:hypothetical protein
MYLSFPLYKEWREKSKLYTRKTKMRLLRFYFRLSPNSPEAKYNARMLRFEYSGLQNIKPIESEIAWREPVRCYLTRVFFLRVSKTLWQAE